MTRQFQIIACTIAIAAGTLLIATNAPAQVRSNPNLLRGNSLAKPAPRPVNVRAPIVNNTFNPNPSQNTNMYQGYNPYPYSTYPSQYPSYYPGINSGYSPYGATPYGSNPYQAVPYGYNPYGYFPGY
jgi:hypothetical protein